MSEQARRLPRSFFDRDTVQVAREMLGKHLVHVVGGVERVGRIVEVEAYLGPHDLAAHSARGQRHQRAIVRLLTYVARRCLTSSPASPFPPTSFDTLYIRLSGALRHSTCLRRRGSQYWEKKWELQRDVAQAVYREHVDGLRQQLARA